MELRKGTKAYIVVKNMYSPTSSFYHFAVALREVHVIECKKRGNVVVSYFEHFGALPEGGNNFQILTKKKKKKGIEIPFAANDLVEIKFSTNANQLYTFDEAKLELIQYIANGFEDRHDIEDYIPDLDD